MDELHVLILCPSVLQDSCLVLDSMKDSSILLQDSKDLTEKERALDKRIHEIKEQNKAIVMRGREIEKDKKRYG